MLISVGINIILCVSLNLVNGYMGEFSVGHAGFHGPRRLCLRHHEREMAAHHAP